MAKKPKVLLYGTEWCIWCQKAREFFSEHKIPFIEIDVESNPKAAQEIIKKSGQQGIPIIDIDGKIIIGFDEEKIRKLLKIK